MKCALVADIGGTNTTLALVSDNKIIRKFTHLTSEISDFTALVKDVLDRVKQRVTSACFAGAGVVTENSIKLTNSSLVINKKQIIAKTSLKEVLLVNDFQAAAHGVLSGKYVKRVNGGSPKKNGVKVVIGAGTGLGKAILFHDGEKYHAIQSEGGHADLPIKKHELAFSGLEYEDVLSGRGISLIYKAISKKKKNKFFDEVKKNKFNPAFIANSRDANCKMTMKLFARFYGRCAKNFFLDSFALGGVYIAGGIAIKNSEIIDSNEFIREFCDNKTYGDLLAKVPIYLVNNYDISLLGCSILINN